MEIVVQPREHVHWQQNLKRFYVIKVVSLAIAGIFFIVTAAIYNHDKDFYFLCDNDSTGNNTGDLVKDAMIMLITFHLIEILALLY